MAANVLVDAGFLIALLNRREALHSWAAAQAEQFPAPWKTCEPVLSEAFHILGHQGSRPLADLLRVKALLPAFSLASEIGPVFKLLDRYESVPMDLADACLVRMSELLPEVLVLTPDSDFRIYRRNGRQAVPCILPRGI